jgi:hypothetical protein
MVGMVRVLLPATAKNERIYICNGSIYRQKNVLFATDLFIAKKCPFLQRIYLSPKNDPYLLFATDLFIAKKRKVSPQFYQNTTS